MIRACIARLGAIGDMVQTTPIYKLYKEKGYHVTAYVKPGNGAEVIKHNPYVDEVRLHDESMDTQEAFDFVDTELGKEYDVYVNLTGVVENNLLSAWYDPVSKWSKAKRHKKCNHNYIDAMLERAELPDRGLNGQLFFTEREERWAKKFIKKHAHGKFFILWSLSGSSQHKSWMWTEDAARAFLESNKDVVICTVGDDLCKLLEWEHPRTLEKSGELTIRQSMVLTKYANLVIGTETGILNAASCFNTPKIIMLSHSTEENLTKYWKECVTILPKDTKCYPCHKLHHSLSTCTLDEGGTGWPLCTIKVRPAEVLNAMEDVYIEWKGV
jgi:ADP-heptose:LPS heptosyltransferase